MPARKVAVAAEVPADLAQALAAARTRLGIATTFPPEVEEAAARAAAAPRLPHLDRTDLDLLTIDPEGSRDLDQALHIAATRAGYVVSYAIADVGAFVTAGDPVDQEARRRGCTFYAPDVKSPLHPTVLSEGAASLLPGEVRPALLWTIRLDPHGQTVDADVVRARVRSTDQLSYEQAQAEIDGGSARATLALLADVGRRREQRERERGGVSLEIPEQEFRAVDGEWRLQFRVPLPVEGWNAQISLLTGMAAAHTMLYGQVGVLRTMPPADPGSTRRLRATAKALHIRWPAELDYPEFVRSLDPDRPPEAAMLNACTVLFRGANYQAFSGGVPDNAEHAALASDYAHVTAPLRRRVDRYGEEICVALGQGKPVPQWVLRDLDGLPAEATAAERRAKKYERAVIDLMEIALLQRRVGETFTGTVIDADADRRHGVVMLREPAVEAKVTGADVLLGHEVRVRLTKADWADGAVAFELA